MAWTYNMRHRAVSKLDDTPISEWGTWGEAAAELLARGLANFVFGVFVMHPGITIEHEGFWSQ